MIAEHHSCGGTLPQITPEACVRTHPPSSVSGVVESTWLPRRLLLILLIGLLVRLGLWVWFAPLPPRITDELDYTRLAKNLLQHGEFGFEPGKLTSLRPPLYPFLVAGVYGVFGLDNNQAVRLLQVFLSLLNVWVLYHLGREVLCRRAGLILAGAFAFYPTMLGYSQLLLTEVVFTLLLTASCFAVVRFYRTEQMGWLAVAGLLLGLSALTRSVVWMAPPFLACWVVLTARSPWTQRLVGAGVLLLSFSATIAPWTIRNTRLQGTFVTIDTMGGRNFMMGNYAHTPLYRAWDAISLEGDKAWETEVRQAYPTEMLSSQGKIDKLALRQGLQFVRENPGLTLLRDVIKFFDFWGLERELIAGAKQGFFGPIPLGVILLMTVVILASYVPSMFLAIFGALFAPPPDRRVHWFFLLVMAFICGMHTLVFGHSRYHLPLMPLVLLYATTAWLHRKTIWEHRRSGRFMLGVGLCLLLLAGWSWNVVAGDWNLVRRMLGQMSSLSLIIR